jgi:hypothetical protein
VKTARVRPDGFLPGSGMTVAEIESGGDGTVGCERDPVGPCP